jgi:CRISPR-associated endonuclease/helicase Cas3
LIGTHAAFETESAFLDWLFESLRVDARSHWLKKLNEIKDDDLGLTRPSAYSIAATRAAFNSRVEADWLSCNGSDQCEATSNNQLQTARRDYFPESAAAIVSSLTREQLERSLFRLWDYGDPIQKVSLHLEPREDRRHAYQWFRPVGDPTRTLHGGMVGANRLAMEAWPLFQSVAVKGDLQTIGFAGTRPMRGIHWTWPLWSVPLAICDVTPVLNLADLQSDDRPVQDLLSARGIATAFRLRRILVEKTPNFTAPVAVFASWPIMRLASV